MGLEVNNLVALGVDSLLILLVLRAPEIWVIQNEDSLMGVVCGK